MKEDILEQLVDDYLQMNGFFTMHNVRFQPGKDDPGYVANDDRVASDVDVVGIHPRRKGAGRVWVVSCKSWQVGFNPKQRITWIEKDKRISGRKAWKGFRELAKRKWADALIGKIEVLTGGRQFTYVTAVTKLKGDATPWQEYPLFRKNLRGNPIVILTVKEMLSAIYSATGKTPAASQVGRLIQVMKASDWKPS